LNIPRNEVLIQGPGEYIMTLTDENATNLKRIPGIVGVTKRNYPEGLWEKETFPYDERFKWNRDNYGPVYIPKAGETIKIDTSNISLYRRVIEAYELNDVEVKNGKVLINGEQADSYTFAMDYYWMMGDNRHNSADSRYWGFVPIDHVVGKAVFVWLSLDGNKPWFGGKIRFNKMFRIVK
jgi:signal peptidase I